ncbi:hypothetical protein H2259_07185 [Campylobacter sp. RM10532]|uniref:hypothetical protein n=1 Tax=Campylobacter TaxID=194 RepID=UPI001EBC7396|nr:hypothetical protein [Campylobacter sp. W0065]MBZ7938005.1 hypothetical protein [Campylobacter sp. RM10538]MBZ7945818.1 hypothetical protein [Campylobacter sp. RM10532]MBZ7966445.1 hypothetical protein [Campylobacter sp. RM10535]MBZ7970775.1 hypothetical protein [Campylobacter sp. RM3125]MBZ7972208.1 hypothetical protein [Campylobacter sp. RM3124]MBZ7973667.1 hypothetical protein [Campylobacter sp. RM9753]
MDEKILDFIKNEQLLSWSMIDDSGVYTASAFYVFDEKNLSLIIASHEQTKHIQLAFKNPSVAVNIAKENKIAFLKGIQAKAEFKYANKEQEKMYFSKFSFAKFDKKARIYTLDLIWAKLTDNTLGLVKKIEFLKKSFII